MQDVDHLGRFHSQGYTVGGCAKLLGRLRKEAQDKLVEIGLLPEKDKKQERNADYPNAYEPWSQEELHQLHSELSGYRDVLILLAAVAKEHGRSIGSIVSRAAREGLCVEEGAL